MEALLWRGSLLPLDCAAIAKTDTRMFLIHLFEWSGGFFAAQREQAPSPQSVFVLHNSFLAKRDYWTQKGSFPTEKSAIPKARFLSFAGHFLDHFARLRLANSLASLGSSLLISERV